MAENKDQLSEPQKEINALVAKAQKALEEYANFDQEKIDYIVAKASVAALDHHGTLAKLAVEETKRGVFEDKATKNLFACEYVVNHMRHLKTVGVVEDDDVTGIVKIAEPVGVVAGLTPVTNPTSTAIFKSLICLKTRNPIIFSFHPNAIKCSIAAAKIVYDAAVAAGRAFNGKNQSFDWSRRCCHDSCDRWKRNGQKRLLSGKACVGRWRRKCSCLC